MNYDMRLYTATLAEVECFRNAETAVIVVPTVRQAVNDEVHRMTGLNEIPLRYPVGSIVDVKSENETIAKFRVINNDVKRVHEVTEGEARLCGARGLFNSGKDAYNSHAYQDGFREIWNARYADPIDWNSNPHVEVVTITKE